MTFSLVISGGAGTGIKTVEEIVSKVLKRSGYHVFASREYMSRVRGGNNSSEIRFSNEPVEALVDRIDLLIALSPGLRPNIKKRIEEDSVIILDPSVTDKIEAKEIVTVPLEEIAQECGKKIYKNSVVAGIVMGIANCPDEEALKFFKDKFTGKGKETVHGNYEACLRGMAIGRELAEKVPPMSPEEGKDPERMVINGTEAVTLGAMAGSCDFVTAYPMSPATGVLTFAAKYAKHLGIAVEQAEDELAAINMAIGASYGGASPLITTSGGGFSLMYEGFSFAGVAEVPLVIHLGQRPGPATGMATRTEQGDLNLAVYGGHGEFPRLVLAPGTIEEAFYMTTFAFEMAHKYQIQAIVLTDQYLLNTSRDIDPLDIEDRKNYKYISISQPDYRRYEDNPSGVSPRSVPGYGAGLVGCDSHEHDEEGHVYEDFDLRVRMSDKRFRKEKGLIEDAIPPLLIGPEEWTRLIVCWGSTFPMVKEAMERLQLEETALVAPGQVWPFSSLFREILASAEDITVIEGNHDGQLEGLIRKETGLEADSHLRNYNGLQFTVEQIQLGLSQLN